MKKEILVIDKEKQILRCTTVDERWYVRDTKDEVTGLPKYDFVPSVTWICENYPKGVSFYKWLASKGWDEAEAIKSAAGDRGSRVHYAIRDLIEGKSVAIDAKYKTADGEDAKELTLDEYECVMSFESWHKEVKPDLMGWEFVVWGDGYAGTIDLLCKIGGQTYLIDFKTSQYIWPSHELQVSAYKHALDVSSWDVKLAILQVGYKLNKKRYKFTEVEDQYALFLAAKEIWKKEQAGVEPKQRDYPLQVKLDIAKETKKEKNDARREPVV